MCPDTSPRNVNIPGEDDAYDFGSGAGFYVDATKEPWARHYRMYSYVTVELIDLITVNFPVVAGKQSISGHSMGGHGALICALRNPGLYQSISAFAPIANPSKGAWGQKALAGYLGDDKNVWAEWDATELVAKYKGDKQLELLVDQVRPCLISKVLLLYSLVYKLLGFSGQLPRAAYARELDRDG